MVGLTPFAGTAQRVVRSHPIRKVCWPFPCISANPGVTTVETKMATPAGPANASFHEILQGAEDDLGSLEGKLAALRACTNETLISPAAEARRLYRQRRRRDRYFPANLFAEPAWTCCSTSMWRRRRAGPSRPAAHASSRPCHRRRDCGGFRSWRTKGS